VIFQNNIIISNTIENAWRDAMWCCIRNGYDYYVKGGSYVGQIRKQLDYVVIKIEQPWIRPLAPRMPEGCGIPPTTSNEKIEQYFYEYIITDTKTDNEDYTYGQFIAPQVPRVIEILNSSKGNTNQGCICVGDPESIYLKDPPCLRVISFKVVDGKLNMTVYFRSWDLVVGLPENLGGLQLLKEYVLMHLDFDVIDGDLIAFSDGLHIYEQYFELANLLNVNKIQI